jgi:hypothetical protein
MNSKYFDMRYPRVRQRPLAESSGPNHLTADRDGLSDRLAPNGRRTERTPQTSSSRPECSPTPNASPGLKLDFSLSMPTGALEFVKS